MKGKSDYEAKGVLGAYMSPYARYLPSRNRRRGKEGEKNLIGVQYICRAFILEEGECVPPSQYLRTREGK